MQKRSKSVLLSVGVIIPILILEMIFRRHDLASIRGIARSYSGERLTDCLVADIRLDHRLTANCEGIVKTRDFEVGLKTNSLGFRDREFTDKTENKKRVVVIGDSFAEGWGVELEDRFDQIGSDKYEILNLGTRSYSPVLERRLLDKYIDILRPDLVISMVDFSDLHDDFYYAERLGIPVDVWPPYAESPTIKLFNHSALFKNIYRLLYVAQSNQKQEINRINLTDDVALFGKAQDWQNYDKAWELARRNLAMTTDFLNSKGVEHSVIVVPRGIHVGTAEWSDGREIIGLTKNKLYEAPQIFEISDIDLLQKLRQAEQEKPGQLYFPFDGHWTVGGHEVVKLELRNYLDNLYQNTLPKTIVQ
jgi:hypothetical protein